MTSTSAEPELLVQYDCIPLTSHRYARDRTQRRAGSGKA